MKWYLFFLMLQSIQILGMNQQITPLNSLIAEALKFDQEIKEIQPKITPDERAIAAVEWKQKLQKVKVSPETSATLTLGAIKKNTRRGIFSVVPADTGKLATIKAYKKEESAKRFLAVLPHYKTIASCMEDQADESDSEDYAQIVDRLDIISLGSIAERRAQEKYQYALEKASQHSGDDLTLAMTAELDQVPVSHLVELKDVILTSCGCSANEGYVADTQASIMRAIERYKSKNNI